MISSRPRRPRAGIRGRPPAAWGCMIIGLAQAGAAAGTEPAAALSCSPEVYLVAGRVDAAVLRNAQQASADS
jgi:hypothetical protein